MIVPEGIKKLSAMFCGCGRPEEAYKITLRLLEYFELDHMQRPCFRDEDYFPAYIIDHAGLIEHGTSIGGSWLTGDGQDALAFLWEYGVEFTDRDDCPQYWGRWVWEPAE